VTNEKHEKKNKEKGEKSVLIELITKKKKSKSCSYFIYYLQIDHLLIYMKTQK
jgi:hypothetical protein